MRGRFRRPPTCARLQALAGCSLTRPARDSIKLPGSFVWPIFQSSVEDFIIVCSTFPRARKSLIAQHCGRQVCSPGMSAPNRWPARARQRNRSADQQAFPPTQPISGAAANTAAERARAPYLPALIWPADLSGRLTDSSVVLFSCRSLNVINWLTCLLAREWSRQNLLVHLSPRARCSKRIQHTEALQAPGRRLISWLTWICDLARR